MCRRQKVAKWRCHRENTGKNKTCLYCGNPLVADRKPTKKGSRLIAIPVAICAVSAVVIIVCSIILMGDKSSKIRDQINLGYRALNEQDYEQAEVCFKKALDLGGDKPSPEAEIGLAETYQNQKKPEEARRYLQQAQKNPTPIPASVVPHYNHVAQQVAIPTITPAPPQTSGGSTGTAVRQHRHRQRRRRQRRRLRMVLRQNRRIRAIRIREMVRRQVRMIRL